MNMYPVSASELASIRADTENATLDLSCEIQRRTLTSDGMGTQTESWHTQETVQCGLSQPTAGQLTNYAFLIGSLSAWQVKLPVGTDVRYNDHLIISGQTLTVQVVLNPRSYAALLTVLASEVK